MLPTIGLYLPESLYPNYPPESEITETPRAKRRLAERKSSERKSIDRRSIAQKSAEDVSKAVSSLSNLFRFADFVASQDEVSSDVEVFVNLIQHVHRDVTLASNLRASPAVVEYCEYWPGKKAWIDEVLKDVQRALDDINAYVENARVTGDEGGVVRMKQKFEWVLTHHQKLKTRQVALDACHRSLYAAILLMQMVEQGGVIVGHEPEGMAPMVYEAPSQPWLRDDNGDHLRGPHSRQKWRMSQRNLSLPSIMVSESDDNKMNVNTVNSTPVELTGSTPDDLPDAENWDLYEPPKSTASVNQITPLPTVSERINKQTEQDNQLEDTSRTSSMPTLAKRYRARPVHVRRPPTKHRSLPTQLPFLPHRPSLVTELQDWMFPGKERDSFDSEDFSYSGDDTPSSSVISSPTMPTSAASCPVRTLSFTSKKNTNSTLMGSAASSTVAALKAPSLKEDSPTLPEQPFIHKPRLEASPENNANGPTTTKSSDTIDRLPDIPSPSAVVDDGAEPMTTGNASPIASLGLSPASVPLPPEIPGELEEQPPDIPMQLTTSSPRPVASHRDSANVGEVVFSQEQIRPMTSQAKRRLAHARRMQAAYGS